MGGLIVFLVIVLISAAIGAVSQVLKNVQQAEQARLADNRAAARGGPGAGGKPAGSDIDRFLEEIDKLRRKSAAGGPDRPAPAAAPAARRPAADVPTVAPARKPPRRLDPPAFAPVPPPPARPVPTAVRPRPAAPTRVEDLPVAPVLPPPAAAAPPATRPVDAPAPPRRGQPTEFGRQLAGLLGAKRSVPMAVVLQEVLGPPKCRKG